MFKNLKKKENPVFLMSFGHCGIDWLHSLIDCNKEVLIMPEFSFYRSWKLIEAEKIQTTKEMVKVWQNYFDKSEQKTRDTKKFYSNREKKYFFKKFKSLLEKNGISKKNVFWSLHESYAYAKKRNINSIKTIVMHEHVSFPYKEIIKDFKRPKFLIILRDPRASIAGFFKGIEKKYLKKPDNYEYFWNMSVEEWMCTKDLLNEKVAIKVIQNENMVKNLPKEMFKLSRWLKIKYSKKLLLRTYSDGKKTQIDSSYLNQKNNLAISEKNYFKPENVEKRWKQVLSDKREIFMIEFLFNDIMLNYNYKKYYKKSFFNNIQGLFFFLLPHRGKNLYGKRNFKKDELKRALSKLKILKLNFIYFILKNLPNAIRYCFILVFSIYRHINMYFFPQNRWKRYDNPKLEWIYRS